VYHKALVARRRAAEIKKGAPDFIYLWFIGVEGLELRIVLELISVLQYNDQPNNSGLVVGG
jgi:hypothetical protein